METSQHNKETKNNMTPHEISLSMAAVPEMTAQMMVVLGRVEEKQETLLTAQNKFETRIVEKYHKLEGRVTVLERENQKKDTKIELLEAELASVKRALPEKAKLGAWLTGIASIMAIVMVFANLNIMTENKQEQSVQFEILKQNQKEINEKVEQ